jgi:hypothetical protein
MYIHVYKQKHIYTCVRVHVGSIYLAWAAHPSVASTRQPPRPGLGPASGP